MQLLELLLPTLRGLLLPSPAAGQGPGPLPHAAAGAAFTHTSRPAAPLSCRRARAWAASSCSCWSCFYPHFAACCSPLLPQGKGLGRFLMQLLELVGRRSGVARLMLTVFHANTAALALYKRLGWVEMK